MGSIGTSKSPSPAHSSDPTTGTTTTPTSIGNSSPPDSGISEEIPDFSRDGVVSHTSHTHSHSSQPQHHTHTFSQEVASGWSGSSPSEFNSHDQAANYRGSVTPTQSSTSQQSDQYARSNPANYAAAFKLLVSNNVAGSIIGRSGQTISEFQKQSSTRIKLSQTGDYYPGTQDRVCLVQGEPENCKAALRLLLGRLHMLQEQQHSQHAAWQLQRQKGAAPLFDFIVRLLVPTSSCGMIIGKSGSNIKFMEESTGVSSVRLSAKETADNTSSYALSSMILNTSERIVTITGQSLDSCLQCVDLILDGMVSHPDICRYANMTTSYPKSALDSYGGQLQPVLLSIPPGPSRMHPADAANWDITPEADIFSQTSSVPRRISSSPDLPGIMLNQRLPLGHVPTSDFLGSYRIPQPSYSPSPGLPGSPSSSHQQVYLLPQPQRQGESSAFEGRTVAHSTSAPELLAVQLEQSMDLSAPTHPPQSQEYSEAFVPQPPTLVAPGVYNVQLLVPDSMIGSILGRGGSTLTELENMSGTRIRASQRGDFVPGTRSRIVKIKGPSAQSVWQAQFMMSQRMVLPPTAAYPAHPPFITDQYFSHRDGQHIHSDDEAHYPSS